MLEKILFVDDETHILKSFKRLFIDTKYKILTAESGEEALNILKEEKVDLIVSDMKMPNMTGYELLKKVKELYPSTVRIILSGFSEERIVYDALQKNIAKLYMLKPWDNEVFINTLEKVFQMENTVKNSNVLKFINSAEQLPTIEPAYEKIIGTIDNEKEIYKIVEAIEHDYTIVNKLLHIVNSSYYGAQTGSIKRAVSYLGVDNIKNIVITSAFIDSLGFNPDYNEKMKLLWKQSFISNRIFNIVYNEFLNKKTPETAMVAGLLCNVGIVYMMHFCNDEYMKIFDKIENNNEDMIKLENEIFGTNHQEIGGYLLKLWDIPLSIIESALYHHNPFDENILNKEIVLVAHISEKYAWDLMEQRYFGEFDEKVFDELLINKEKFESRIKNSLELTGLL